MSAPRFEKSWLTPRYWPTWCALGLLYLFSWLPYRLQMAIGRLLGLLMPRFAKKRVAIAARNIALCFPELTAEQQQQLVRANCITTAQAVMEIGMSWFWPNWRIRRHMQVRNQQLLLDIVANGQIPLVISPHFVTLEMQGRVIAQFYSGTAVYRPHNNPLMDWVQYRGRVQGHKYLISKRKPRDIIKALRQGDGVWYAPDQDYGAKVSVFAPFFAVKQVATVTATAKLAGLDKVVPILSYCVRKDNGYEVVFENIDSHFPSQDALLDATTVNQLMERAINTAPDHYMWLHRRFKTRPEGEPSLYD